MWCIANCVALENEIFQEHVLYNNSAMLSQLGFDLKALAREVGNSSALLRPQLDQGFGEAERTLGQGKPARMAPPTAISTSKQYFATPCTRSGTGGT